MTQKGVTVPQGWPAAPERVSLPFSAILFHCTFDFLLLACCGGFLALALIVNHYDQVSTTENPNLKTGLENATKYVTSPCAGRHVHQFILTFGVFKGPTIFPILFASIIGRATHAILLWRLEKGEHVGILDMLAASTSLTSTITS